MATFTGAAGADVITPTKVSAGVTKTGGPAPGAKADTLIGGGGDDTLDGGTGGDSISGGAGNDLVLYSPTAASDHQVVDGGLGSDTLQVNGSATTGSGWTFSVGATASSHAMVTGTRAGQAFDIDAAGVEIIALKGSGVGDHFIVGDHTRSPVQQVLVDLGASSTGAPDGAADDLTLNTTAGADQVVAQLLNGDLTLTWNGHKVQVHNLETGDHVSINSGEGDDVLDLARTGAKGPTLFVDAGAGNDTLRGANAVLLGGAGDDSFLWARDGNDTMDGGSGGDTQTLTTAGVADQISLSAAGNHVSERVAGSVLDAVGIETINLQPGDGADSIRIGELTATDVRVLNIDLAGSSGGPDGAADSVTFAGPADGFVDIANRDNGATLEVATTARSGIIVDAFIRGADATDLVTFQGTTGADSYNVNLTQQAPLIFDLGEGDDQVIGTLHNSTVSGGGGDDLLLAGGGGNRVDGGAGADTITAGDFDQVHGGDGDDAITGVGVGSVLFGDGGNDAITTAIGHETVFGGDGADTIQAEEFDEMVFGDAGDDLINLSAFESSASGGDGNDTLTTSDHFGPLTLQGGAGDDVFEYTVLLHQHSGASLDGGSGFDILTLPPDRFFLTDLQSWTGELTANQGTAHLRLTHGVDVNLDTVGIESIALGGGSTSDRFVVGNLSGTAVTFVGIELGDGSPDRVDDQVILEATAGADVVTVRDTATGDLAVSGLPATVVVTDIDALAVTGGVHDNIFLRTEAGNDLIDMQNMNVDHALTVLTGAGNDTIVAGFGPADFNFDIGLQGSDRIVNFRNHSIGGRDHIDVGGLGDDNLSAMKLAHHIFQSGADVVITDGAGSFLTLSNMSLSSLASSDFLF